MSDMNFFSTFLDKKLRKRSKQMWVIFILVALIVIAACIYFDTDIIFSGIKSDIAAMKNQITDYNQKANSQKLKAQLLQSYRKYEVFIDKTDKVVKNTQTLTADSLEAIGKSMPPDAYLLTCNILNGQVDLKGKSTSSIAVGIFCKNLQQAGLFTNVSILSITMDDSGTYDFDVTCEIEGGTQK